jgi:ribosomal protein L16/L10AE
MLSPRRTKFRKQQRGRMNGLATRGSDLNLVTLASSPQNQPGLHPAKLKPAVEP